jgi:hypothetical protein
MHKGCTRDAQGIIASPVPGPPGGAAAPQASSPCTGVSQPARQRPTGSGWIRLTCLTRPLAHSYSVPWLLRPGCDSGFPAAHLSPQRGGLGRVRPPPQLLTG